MPDHGALPELACWGIGPPLSFERLWPDTGRAAGLAELQAERAFEFAVERAVVSAVLHRPMAPGSDRA